MRKAFVASLAMLAVLAAGAGAWPDVLPGGAEGCIVNGQELGGPTGPLTHASSCSFTATRDGGYVAYGDWTLVVNGTTYTPANAPDQGCALWAAGTVVSVGVGGAGSFIAAGNPYPSAGDGVRPPTPCP